MPTTRREAGFVVSTEVMLIALILVAGLVTGWVKLRDQSLAEVTDAMAAIDAYLLGSTSLWQTGGTRWIATDPTCAALMLSSPCIVGPSGTGVVSDLWGVAATSWPTAEPSLDPNVYVKKDGILVYGAGTGTQEGGSLLVVGTGSTEEVP